MSQPIPNLPYGAGYYAGVLVTATQRDYIQSGISRGLSGNETYRQMQAAGVAPRRQAFFDVRNELLGRVQGGRVLGNTPKKFVPSVAAFPLSNVKARTTYRVSATTTHTVDGPTGPIQATFKAVVSFNTIPTMAQLDAALLKQLGPALEEYGIAEEDVSFGNYLGESFA